MPELPSGTVTLLFTDIEGSTRLLEALGDDYGRVLEEHHRRVNGAVAAHGGTVVDVQGDGFFVAFARADEALAAAAEVQRSLADLEGVRVRMGVHTGQPRRGGTGYVGVDVHRAARICAAAHGGQVLVSETTHALVPEATVLDLGEHRLRDLTNAQRLYQLAGEGLETSFPPLRTLENRPTNLPVQPTPLIGRERELAAVAELVRRPNVQLVTLHGPGGCGKTRLALQAAADLIDDFPEGVFFVALEAVQEPRLVVATVAQTLGVNEAGATSLRETLGRFLENRRLLIVLDNFEHLLEAAPAVSELLAASAVSVLVTSRAALRVSGEHELAVPPLALPELHSVSDPDALSQYESVALFIDRAQAVSAQFAVTDENARAIAEICVRLDGLPLAIELAAARTRMLPPQAMLARLADSLGLLTTGPRDRPSRQQTLRGAIDWSYGLLSEGEARLFARLAVFAGGCRLEAAEAVCEAQLDEFEALIANSLVRQHERPGGEPRFTLLETIREYATERLDASGEQAKLRRRHAEYLTDWAWERSERRRKGTLEGDWLPEADEYENIRSALGWARDVGEIELELRLAAAMGFVWAVSGYLSEGRQWLEDVLRRADAAPPAVRALALSRAAHCAWRQGDPARTFELAEAGQALFEELGDSGGVAACLMARAIASDQARQIDEAAQLYDQAEAIYREVGDERGLSISLNNRAYTAMTVGDWERAQDMLEEVVSMTSGRVHAFPYGLQNLGVVHVALGRADAAEASFTQALRALARAGETDGVYYAIEGLAVTSALRRQDVLAAKLWGAAEAMDETGGYRLGPVERELHERAVPESRERAGHEAFDRAWAAGRVLSSEQAVALALESSEAG